MIILTILQHQYHPLQQYLLAGLESTTPPSSPKKRTNFVWKFNLQTSCKQRTNKTLVTIPGKNKYRAEYISTIIGRLKVIGESDSDSKLRRWVLIYRHLGEQYDLFIGEDKSGSASATDIKKDSKKCDNVRIDMLKAGTSMSELVENLEATAQTYSIGKFKIMMPSPHYVHKLSNVSPITLF
ncbi:hypothetical protein BDC45DRAFT_535831 [Circinella umbellata]|nr:hypothetical protein BDC45DRAFT_585603 [Circinella umbellata]KAI7853949.1 hypothetical protein BDC45DRAFT_535831 [Circinella umbellata]